MKSSLLFLLVSGSLMFAALARNENDSDIITQIDFSAEDWEKIKQKARTENKLIFLDVYTAWCGPCKLLKKTTFSNDEVGTYFNTNFINAAFNAEEGEGKIIAKQYRVTAYPTMLFVDGEGKIVKAIVGYKNARQLMKLAKSI